jgi:DNA helicase-2/ATP-dependent DNA helicase PcrA
MAFDQNRRCWDLMTSPNAIPGVTTNAMIAMRDFASRVGVFRERIKQEKAARVVEEFLDEIGFSSALRSVYTDPLDHQARMASVTELIKSVDAFETRNKRRSRQQSLLGQFLNELALRGNAAKGLEFPVTYLVGLEEGLLPHYRSLDMGDSAIDEERRLAYVGVTRAQEHLTLSYAKQRTKRGKPKPSIPSRFLVEMIGRPIVPPKPNSSTERRPRRRVSPRRSQ